MNTSQKFLVSLILGTSVVGMTSLVSANYGNDDNHDNDRDGGSSIHADLRANFRSNRDEIKANWKTALESRKHKRASIHADRKALHSEFGFIGFYFREDLSDAQKATINARIETFQNDREALFEAMIEDKKADGEIDNEAYAEEFAELRADYYADLRIYVDTDKRDKYDAFVAARTDVVVKNMAIREETRAGNKALIEENKELKAENKAIIKASKLDAMKDKFSLFTEEALEKLLDRVNAGIENTSNVTLKTLLGEIKAYIEVLIALK